MEKRVRRVVERPQGAGEIYRGDKKIGDVSYSLIVEKEYIIEDSFGSPPIEIESMGSINGTITFFGQDVGFMPEGTFQLKLKDGRELGVSLLPGHKTYRIAVSDSSKFR